MLAVTTMEVVRPIPKSKMQPIGQASKIDPMGAIPMPRRGLWREKDRALCESTVMSRPVKIPMAIPPTRPKLSKYARLDYGKLDYLACLYISVLLSNLESQCRTDFVPGSRS